MMTARVQVPKPFTVYQEDRLPSGFRYPERLLHFASSGEYPAIYGYADQASFSGIQCRGLGTVLTSGLISHRRR
jgi:hypothetical protein